MYTVPPEMQISCRIAHTPFKYPGSGGGSQCARWVGIQQHPTISKIRTSQKESCYREELRQISCSPKQMPWEPSKMKDIEKQLEGKEYY